MIAVATSSESALDDSEIFAAADAFLKVPPTVIDLELAPALFFLSPPMVFMFSILHETIPASFSLLYRFQVKVNCMTLYKFLVSRFWTPEDQLMVRPPSSFVLGIRSELISEILPITILKQYFRGLSQTFFIIEHKLHFALNIVSFFAV